MNEIIAGVSIPLINIVLIIAALSGINTLIDQGIKFFDLQAKRNEKKRELQAQFAAFLKAREKTQGPLPKAPLKPSHTN
ncbi:hypothetical protein B5P43_18530 [Bacillus sp. SRB_336]|nr:hypothetical protein B5P43_18530 [Bacillus sp. SRB_336]